MKERSGFIFYRSFGDAAARLAKDDRLAFLEAVIRYGLDGTEPAETGLISALFALVRPQIDANNTKREHGSRGGEYGVLGGRPQKQNPTKTPDKPHENPTKTPDEPQQNGRETPKEKGKEKEESIKEKNKEESKSIKEKGAYALLPDFADARFDYSGDQNFSGIPQSLIASLKNAFPTIDIDVEIGKAAQWLANEATHRPSDIGKFLLAWFQRAQGDEVSSPQKTTGRRWEI